MGPHLPHVQLRDRFPEQQQRKKRENGKEGKAMPLRSANRKSFNFIQRHNQITNYVTKLRMKLSHAPERVRKINLKI